MCGAIAVTDQAADLVARVHEPLGQAAADESGRSCDKHLHQDWFRTPEGAGLLHQASRRPSYHRSVCGRNASHGWEPRCGCLPVLKEDTNLFNKLRSHLSFANVVAMIALFVALSGTSYAVSKIGPKDIRKNAVRAKHIKKSQVRSKQIKNRSVRASDLAPGVIGTTLQSSAGQARRDAGPTGVAASQNYTTVATLGGLEPGSYVLLAKANQSSNTRTEGRCRLSAGDQYDDSNRGLREQGTPEAHASSSCTPSRDPARRCWPAARRRACGRRPTRRSSRSRSRAPARTSSRARRVGPLTVEGAPAGRPLRHASSRRPRPAGSRARPKATARRSRSTRGSRCRSPWACWRRPRPSPSRRSLPRRAGRSHR